jgi:hypothetical protein
MDMIETTKPCLQFGKACRPTKGEDRVFVFELAGGRALLVGVADGLSSENGGAAAGWIERTMHDVANASGGGIPGARELFKCVADALVTAEHPASATDSLSTLSCGICQLKHVGDALVLHFDFFGVGDSPIWRVVPLIPAGELGFQASVVYDSPTPREQGLVYSFVSLLDRKIEGRPHFGSVELAEDELLVLASDGVPEWRIFGEDQDPKYSTDSPKLIDRLFEAPSITDTLLKEILFEYDRKSMLVDDDASIAVVRWRYPRTMNVEADNKTPGELGREGLLSKVEPESSAASPNSIPVAATELPSVSAPKRKRARKIKHLESNKRKISKRRKKIRRRRA